jgi:integrase
LHLEAQAAVQAWIHERSPVGDLLPSAALFPSRRGTNQPISRVQAHRILKKAFDANELSGPLATHTMRKTFADRVYDALGHDLMGLQMAMGHASIQDTARYIQPRQDVVHAAILAS